MDWIDYRQLPPATGGFSQLFFDYLYDFDEVKRFFPSNFRTNDSYENLVRTVQGKQLDRQALSRVLLEQNSSFGCSQKTLDNIELLKKPTTLAIVTGQQVGLFGGPLYTVFKTVTAIKLAEKLKAKFPSLDFVPAFWIEGEDHDFAEMNHTYLLDSDNKPVRIEYLHGDEMPERNLGAIGELMFDASLEKTLSSLGSSLQKTEFTPGLLDSIRAAYAPGRTFNQAFVRWMNFLFEDYGIVFLSPNHPELKKLVSPIFVKEITEFPKTSQLVIAQSAELEEQYHAQVKPKSLNLFMFHKGGRYLIQPRETENDFSLKGTRHFIQPEELHRIARETPELLSANVILRPIIQDVLLPTVAYVAGPSEVAYHAQIKPVYEFFDVAQPIVYPRASASFVEERLLRAMEKYGLDLLEFLEDTDRVTAKVSEQISSIKLEEVFGNAGSGVRNALNEMKFGLKEVDPTLIAALENVQSKIEGSMSGLKEKAIAAQKRRNETALRQIERAANGLLPNGTLQEREISVLYYMNKYGPELVKWISAELDISAFKHQLLTL
ncbi:MAG: bacillithiol biosynthesis cysteine-adding enzyme BshC [Bacteroidetes bacterium]|nr:bacillithiol biosynthesis cysteine-adding enzyme BshC [Bacteroidota bacterium]MCW5896981.1 bacillithiol biosynthesis cysteine-adding enzyme BshC [Bacteroidota bacterium]